MGDRASADNMVQCGGPPELIQVISNACETSLSTIHETYCESSGGVGKEDNCNTCMQRGSLPALWSAAGCKNTDIDIFCSTAAP